MILQESVPRLDRAIFTWEGYPLSSGKNDVKLVFNSLPADFSNKIEIRMNVAVTKDG